MTKNVSSSSSSISPTNKDRLTDKDVAKRIFYALLLEISIDIIHHIYSECYALFLIYKCIQIWVSLSAFQWKIIILVLFIILNRLLFYY